LQGKSCADPEGLCTDAHWSGREMGGIPALTQPQTGETSPRQLKKLP
jgi:hypothetical protein